MTTFEIADAVKHEATPSLFEKATIARRLGAGLVRCEWAVNGIRMHADLPTTELSKVETHG